MNQTVLAKGIEIVGVLFAAFGGFFAGIAPPQAADARFAVGLSSFLALIILFVIAAASKKTKKARRIWLIVGCGLFVVSLLSAYYYKTTYDHLTFEYPPGAASVEHVAGADLTPDALKQQKENPGISNSQLLAKFGGLKNKGEVWRAESVNRARIKLIGSYLVLVLAISGAIFALTEGVLGQKPVRKA
jgi:predicted membrane channel-forming protein YqfA (hemolysin III family)